MTYNALDRIGLKLARQKEKEAPPPSSDLGAAIEKLIREAATAGAEAAVEKQTKPVNQAVPVHRQEFTSKPESHEFPPPPPTTAPPRDFTMLVQRDELGRIETFTVGTDAKFQLQRDARGRTVRVVQLD